jgi:hypothetical protein
MIHNDGGAEIDEARSIIAIAKKLGGVVKRKEIK